MGNIRVHAWLSSGDFTSFRNRRWEIYHNWSWKLQKYLWFVRHSDELWTQSLTKKTTKKGNSKEITHFLGNQSPSLDLIPPILNLNAAFEKTCWTMVLPLLSSDSGWVRTHWRWWKDSETCLVSWGRCRDGGSYRASCSCCPCDEPHEGFWREPEVLGKDRV